MRANSRFLTAAALMFAVVGCGEGGTGPTGGGNSLDASIAGEPGYDPPAASVTGTYVNNNLAIEAAHTTGAKTVTIRFNLPGRTTAGPVVLNQNVGGQFAQVMVLDNGQLSTWSTGTAPGSGTVDIATLTSTRVTGTFNFTGQAIVNNPATGTKAVSNGSFAIDF